MQIAHVLQQVQPEVIELTQPMSPKMMHIQNAILVALEACLGELKRSLPQLDASQFTIDNGIFKSFDMKLRSLLEPEWHKLSWKIKNLVSDLTTIRNLFDFLLRYDAITFYSHLMALKQGAMDSTIRSGGSKQNAANQQSLWLTTVAADEIFRYSWERIFESVPIGSYMLL
jgi:DNA excision repair protein ERCC-4